MEGAHEMKKASLSSRPPGEKGEDEEEEKEAVDVSFISGRYVSAVHYLGRDHHHFSFCASHSPALTVSPGELIQVQTWDCFAGRVTDEASALQDFHDNEVNPATGPIFVRGAEKGDTLSVTIHHIRTEGRGCARTFKDTGQLCHLMPDGGVPVARFFDVSADGGTITMLSEVMQNAVSFPSSPMLGVIGLAPKGEESLPTMPAGKHGGNLDNNNNGIGATVHLPVQHEGGLLSMGDMHAAMGDGEICGTGIEINGDVLISVRLLKGVSTSFPVTETASHWITHGVAEEDVPAAMRLACEEAAGLLCAHWKFNLPDAFIFLSVQGNLGVAQVCHPSKGTVIAKLSVPKLKVCPSPFPPSSRQ